MAESCRNCSAEIPDGETFCAQCTPPASGGSDRSLGGPSVPELPPRYEIIRLLGRGGMGRVFLCLDTHLDVEVAIKVLPPDLAADEHALEEIRKEARLSAKLRDCPGIIVLYAFETYRETNYLVMEYAPGGSLRERLKAGELIPEKLCRKIGLELLRALAHAHQRKVLHRDIKPANVLFDRSGRARLADFGLAKVLADTSTRKSLRTVAGTPSYIPPEIIDQQQADGRADLYSLGCMLYEMATGVTPYKGTIVEVLAAKLVSGEGGPPDPRAKQVDLSMSFATVIRKLMATNPDDRYPDAETAFAALRDRTVAEEPPPRPHRARALIVLSAIVAMLIAAILIPILGSGDPEITPGENLSAEGTADPPAKPADPLPEPPEEVVSPTDDAPQPPPPIVVEGIMVFTDPPGATVSVNGAKRGVAGEEGLLLSKLTAGVPLVITLSHPGCEPAEEAGGVWSPGERRELRVTLVRRTGTLLFKGGVSGAAVWAKREGAAPRDLTLGPDGTLGPVPFEFGEYELVVSKHGYHIRELTVRVEAGGEGVVDASLTEKDGRLTVDTDPSGAVVYSGETRIGTTPLDGLVLGPGRHQVRFDHPDRDPFFRAVDIRGEQESDLGILVLPPLAVLDLRALPDDVTATIDGKELSGRVALRSGLVELLLQRAKHETQRIVLTLRSGETSTPSVSRWMPLPGRIDLSGQPEDVDPFLDGRLLADTTAPVSAGAHRLDLYRPDHRPVRLDVTVEPEETLSLPEIKWVRQRYRPMVRDLVAPPAPDLTTTSLPRGVFLHERRIYWEKDDAEMAVVPTGVFDMGSAPGADPDTSTYRVTVSAFLMDRYEVTNEQFTRFVKESGYETIAEGLGRFATWRRHASTKDRDPVVNLCYGDAVAYAAWAGKRLPTEAEFEWALRGGLVGRVYPWGDDPPTENRVGNLADKACLRKNPRAETFPDYNDRYAELAPAASFEPNAFGLFDLSGNLHEWVADWFGLYPNQPQTDPRGPELGTLRILRGGSWSSSPASFRCGSRIPRKPELCAVDAGFRCVVSLPR